jgi:Domain of unknown function (DUF4157)
MRSGSALHVKQWLANLDRSARGHAPHGARLLQRKCACGNHTASGECETCAKKNDTRLQRYRRTQHPDRADRTGSAPEIVHEAIRTSGQSLERNTRDFMEARFGHDFSHVRLHTDATAARSARAVNALAYTVGRHVAFATGQYAPQSDPGRKLLAHELAHVAQQGTAPASPAGSLQIDESQALEKAAERTASWVMDEDPHVGGNETTGVDCASAQVVQRIPAPPSYNKVTGSIDLSKLQFTPIADFKVGTLRAPLTLTPTLIDASLVHLSWELYDPTDKLVAGYSTLPGTAISKTSTFQLEPAMFQTGKAPTGRYTMRLVGRNSAHEPIAYFDRLFFVFSADLRTGTPQRSGYGDLTFTEYSATDGDFANGIDYVVNIKMNFMAKADAVDCNEIGFIQVLESSNLQGKSNHPFAGAAKAARATALNYSVDRARSGPSPFYGTFRNPKTKAIEPSRTTYIPGKGGHAPQAAKLEDQPSWTQPTVDRFESCATCRNGKNSGQVYGCVTWGFAADAAGRVTLMTRGYSTSPSDTLKGSLTNWNTWRSAQTKPSDFEAAPALK